MKKFNSAWIIWVLGMSLCCSFYCGCATLKSFNKREKCKQELLRIHGCLQAESEIPLDSKGWPDWQRILENEDQLPHCPCCKSIDGYAFAANLNSSKFGSARNPDDAIVVASDQPGNHPAENDSMREYVHTLYSDGVVVSSLIDAEDLEFWRSKSADFSVPYDPRWAKRERKKSAPKETDKKSKRTGTGKH